MYKKKALVTGIYGQDGSYMAEILTEKGYDIYGIVKTPLSNNSQKIKRHLDSKGILLTIINVDLCDYGALKKVLLEIKPTKIFHFSAYHASSESLLNNDFNDKILFEHNIISTLNLLSITYEYLINSKIVTAGSCLMFDNSNSCKQNEQTPYSSSSMYGLAKITEASLVKYYRDKGLNASVAILYNHESSRRKDTFLTKKIIKNLVAIKNKELVSFSLGNIDIKKDWGYAKDYVYAMFLMSCQNDDQDYILSSGTTYSIRDFINIAAQKLNITNWEDYIDIDTTLLTRKSDIVLKGDSTLAQNKLEWKYTLNLEELIDLMIQNELNESLE